MGPKEAAFSQILRQAGWEASAGALSFTTVLQHCQVVKRDAMMAMLAAGERRMMDAETMMTDAGMADGKR